MLKKGFTLAEILITLAIVGVVAAMTLPTLISKINKSVADNQIKVFNAKLIKGMNLTKAAGELNNTYKSTYEFLTEGLGKNLKMAKICDNSHIRDCVPYDKIKYDKNGTEKAIDIFSLKTASDLQINNTSGTKFADTAAFVLADGTPVIVTYDLNCIEDSGKADTIINKCLAGIYDLNGSRKPNKYGETISKDEKGNDITTHNSDLLSFNGARIADVPLAILGGVKIMTAAIVPTPLTKEKCEELVEKNFPIKECALDEDYWAGAVKLCKDQGYKLPTDEQLTIIASELYGVKVSETKTTIATLKTENIPTSALSGLGGSFIQLWSSTENNANTASYRSFYPLDTGKYETSRNVARHRAVCVE